MCGICGEFSFTSRAPAMSTIERMNAMLAKRGPDHGGAYLEGPLALGHRRLAVIDLSYRAHQPMVDSQLGLVLVFNGAIYNYRELRITLRGLGYVFFSDSDTEVILKAYHAWGRDCPKHLAGMFAFAIWDIDRRELFVARDRMGIKPLYYSRTATHFRFASNTQALLATGGIDTHIDEVALHHHLTLHAVVPAPRTLLKGIRKLEPGSSLRILTNGHVEHHRYWRLRAVRTATHISEVEWIEKVHSCLQAAVEKRMTSADVPVGVLLSGGLDSSLLVGLLREMRDHEITTFSIGFDDAPEEKGSEFEYSDLIAERFHTHHHRIQIPNHEVLDRLPEALSAMSEPMVAQDAVAFYLLAEQVAQQVKVVLSGQGADEVFGGYFWYARMAETQGSPEHGRSDVERFSVHYFDRSHDEYLQTVHPDLHGEDYTSYLVAELLAERDADTFLDRVLRMDVTTLIVDDPVKRVDNMTMAWGLESRMPFLDHELVQLASNMPPELKLRANGKYPLKEIARRLLPHAVIDRPKGYFPMPALKYVRGPFLEFMREVLTSPTCRNRHLFRHEYVDRLLSAPEQHLTPLQGSKLWHLAALEYWLQTQVDQAL